MGSSGAGLNGSSMQTATRSSTGPARGLDSVYAFGGIVGDIPITGDWSGTGTTKIGIYRPATGTFILDYNGNGVFDGPLIDRVYQFVAPAPGDVPVTGDWTGTGTTKIGIFRATAANSGYWIQPAPACSMRRML